MWVSIIALSKSFSQISQLKKLKTFQDKSAVNMLHTPIAGLYIDRFQLITTSIVRSRNNQIICNTQVEYCSKLLPENTCGKKS